MSKVLVAYFSASGVTKKLAEKLANVTKADLFEIVPEVPYTEADLDWRDKNSRSSVEMNDRTSRPKIASKLEDTHQYQIVYVGFPVWWYREPSIIDTFIESYDLTGKKVIPFATSGVSPIGDSGKNLQELASGALVLEGKRFAEDVSDEELSKWVKEDHPAESNR